MTTSKSGFGKQPFGKTPFGEGGHGHGDGPFLTEHSNPEDDGSPRDLAINTRQDIFFASNGDLAVVNGRTNIKQSVGIDVLDTIAPDIGGTVKPTTINRIQSEIRDVLKNDPQVSTVISVEPISYDTENQELEFGVKTVADDEYRITLESIDETYTSENEDDGTTVKYSVADETTY